jgi:hypothetical protein
MGSSVSKAKKLKADKTDELDQLLKILDSKREQFQEEVILNRGTNISKSEVNGGRSVVRQSELRVASSTGPDSQIKAAIGSFFDAAQGGNKGRQGVINGATQLVSAGMDALFGVSAGQGMEKRGFIVLFLNFAFVRVDYFVYSYCVTGKAWGAEDSTSGSCQVTDLAVLDPSTLTPMEIDYLIAQNITIDDLGEGSDKEFQCLMQIKIMMSTSTILSRILKDPKTTFDILTKTLDQIKGIMQALAGELAKLPEYESQEDSLSRPLEDWDKMAKEGDKQCLYVKEFIEELTKFDYTVDDATNGLPQVLKDLKNERSLITTDTSYLNADDLALYQNPPILTPPKMIGKKKWMETWDGVPPAGLKKPESIKEWKKDQLVADKVKCLKYWASMNKNRGTLFDKLSTVQKVGISKLYGYMASEYNGMFYKPYVVDKDTGLKEKPPVEAS